ncbi:MAG: hypothetical protein ACOZIN_17120 [Myxococcota bacterium]
MNRLLLTAAFAALAFLGCPKNVPTTVAGSDDEQMDQHAAKLEELNARAKAQEPSCSDWCSMASQVCDLRTKVCDIAGRHADRADMQNRCVASQENCAQFNDSCTSCQR